MTHPRSADAPPGLPPGPRRLRPVALATAAAVLVASIAMTTQALLHPVPLVAQDADLAPAAVEMAGQASSG